MAVVRTALGIALTGLVLYLVFVGLLFGMQRRMVFQPDTRPITPRAAGLPGFESIEISPGVRSWWHPPSGANAPVILYFHGNGGALAGRAHIFSDMASWGFGVLAVGYPGYGGNAGSPSEATISRTAQANYDWLIARGTAPSRIVITAHSMGTGVAVPLAARNRAAGLILESPFTALADVAQKAMPYAPVQWLIRDPFRSSDHASALTMPVAWMHGTADTVIPFPMGQRLFDMIKAPKCALRIEGGDHDHLWDMGASDFTKRQALAMVATGKCATEAGHQQ